MAVEESAAAVRGTRRNAERRLRAPYLPACSRMGPRAPTPVPRSWTLPDRRSGARREQRGGVPSAER